MRGQTSSTTNKNSEILNFSGHKKGYAYRLVEFDIYPTENIGTNDYEMCASITAGKTASDPVTPNFNDEGLIATILVAGRELNRSSSRLAVINDTFMITQNLILTVKETQNGTPVNWQCRFEAVKMSGPEEAVTNYKQYLISDE